MSRKISFLLSILVGCTWKPESEPVPYYPIPEEVRPYVVFPKGSYWIYEDPDDERIDSVYLYRSEAFRQNGAQDFGFDFDLYIAGFSSSFTGDSTRGTGLPFQNDQKIWSYSEGFLSYPSGETALTFLLPLDVSQSRRYAEDFVLTCESNLESIDINGVRYNSVKIFRHNMIFFSESIGTNLFRERCRHCKKRSFQWTELGVKKTFH